MQMAEGAVKTAYSSRSFPGEAVNGDAVSIQWHEGMCRIALIDALGHGPSAFETACRAVEVLTERPDLGPIDAINLCHAALHGTRGAAMSIAHIDSAQTRLTFVGIGNVDARLHVGGREYRPVPYRGIVGYTMRTVRSEIYELPDDWHLAMFTDGITGSWDFSRVTEHAGLQRFVDEVLIEFSRDSDDATIVVAKPRRAA